MHHGQSRGELKVHKVCKETGKFYEIRRENCKSRGENTNFAK